MSEELLTEELKSMIAVQKVLKTEKIAELGMDDRLKELLAVKTPKEFFEKDPHLTDAHFERTQKVASQYLKHHKMETADLVEFLKEHLFFIEMMYAQIYTGNPDIEPRPGQVLGSKLMAISHFFKGSFIGEYPTGSGKSFMYLVYASSIYAISGQRTCVATAGINLQEQLDHKDLPFVASIYQTVTGSAFPYVLIKGRQNYACNVKLERIQGVVDARIPFAGVDNQKAFTDYINKIPREGFDGDLSNINASLSQEIKEAITVKDAASGGCNRCEARPDCYFYTRSKRSGTSAVVVINYHVFYTEYEKIKTPGFLSGGKPDAYIFDEAHEFSIIGRDFSERSFGTESIQWIGARLTHIEEMATESSYKGLKLLSFSKFGGVDARETLSRLKKTYLAYSERWLSFIEKKGKFASSDIILETGVWFDTKTVSDLIDRFRGNLCDINDEIARVLGYSEITQIHAVEEQDPGRYADEIRVINAISELDEVLMEYKILAGQFMNPYRDDTKEVFWVSKYDESISLKAKRTEIETLLMILSAEDKRLSTVSVSATLAVNNSFTFYKSSVNIPNECVSFEVVGESPFDLKTQELWYLPLDAPSGKAADSDYDRYVADRVIELLSISNGGALVLFTSKRSMDYVYGVVSGALKHMTIYKQGDSSKKILLDLFTKDVDSVLFANKSFFTGIDVKGHSLRLIILDKLPFENPTDPVSRVLSSKPGGFKDYAIPTMVTTLKQIIGRGIRSRTDKCVVAFMDNRLKTAGYAGLVRATFSVGGNRSSRTENLEEVIEFMNAMLIDHKPQPQEIEVWDDETAFKGITFPRKGNMF